jgi:hypothetical protein
MDLLTSILVLAPVIAASDDSSSVVAIPLLLCLSGFIYFAIMYARYRNADKRHSHESETNSDVSDVKGYDQLIEHRTRLSSSSMSGANDSQIEGALNTGDNPLKSVIDIGGQLLGR